MGRAFYAAAVMQGRVEASVAGAAAALVAMCAVGGRCSAMCGRPTQHSYWAFLMLRLAKVAEHAVPHAPPHIDKDCTATLL